ncbi:response regulator [Micromonospora sp. NPDC047134]|uniref:response regulator n=1 Tax=Micromonospora sp. NPDC047134 TaxID=3154340 RepID=UPI0033FA7C87
MTRKPRGLIVDDKPDVVQRVRKILDYGFSKLGDDWEVQWHSAGDPVEALKLVREVKFDFALIDFELQEGETGLSVVEELRHLRKNECYILVTTAEANRNPDFERVSRNAGADHAIIRTNRLTVNPARGDDEGWDAYSLARKIRRRLRVLDRADEFKIVFAEEAGVQSMLHSLGDPPGEHHNARTRGELIARTLILECLESESDNDATLTVRHLAAGRSGAYVCKVVREEPGEAVESFVLKIGLDRAALEAEKAANRAAARTLRSHVLVRLDRDLKRDEASGYSAIAAELVDDAVTLGEWLQRPGTTVEQVITLADELHGHQLIHLLQKNLCREALTADWLTMSPVLRLRVYDALNAYAEVWKDERGAGQRDTEEMAAVIRAFVESGVLPATAKERLGNRVIHAHGFGDLHSANVLVQVTDSPRALLVDASNYAVHHWATDVTRLLVDLVLRVRRPGIESMLWSEVSVEADFASGLCHCTGEVAVGDAALVDAYIARVVAERSRYLSLDTLQPREVDWHWQWHVALAREFLRQGSRPGLIPTRAVVALTAAARHLDQAAASLRD